MPFEKFLKRTTALSIAFGLLVPIGALIGWQTGIQFLKCFGVMPAAMNPATAIVFVTLSLSFLFHTKTKSWPFAAKISLGFAVLGLIISIVKVFGFFGVDVQIDQFLYRQQVLAEASQQPNRMAPNTTLNFIFLAISLILLRRRERRALLAIQILASLTAFTAVLIIIGYSYESKEFLQVTHYLPMAFNTAITFLALSVGILCAHPEVGFLTVLLSPGPGGLVSRRLIPVVVVLPIALGWLRVLGERHGLYGMEFGTALTIAITVTISGAFIWWVARILNRSDVLLQSALADVGKLNQVLSQQNGTLQAGNEALEAFAAAVSHDLRAPLRSISGFSQILKTDYASVLDDEGRKFLSWIVGGADTMSKLIDSLLRLARYERQALDARPIHLSSLANQIASSLQRQNPERKVTFNIQESLQAQGDQGLLEVALSNLLANAWKYTGHKPQGEITFGRKELQGKPTYFIADNGAGFDMAYADKLFGTFQRLHSTEEFEGIGIGLTIVQRIIHRHGGKIWAEAKLNEGATFYFTLPSRILN